MCACVWMCVCVCVTQALVERGKLLGPCLTQHTATHCNTLQHTATHCNTLQHNATHCNTLQHIATHCNTLQHTATHCNTLQLTAILAQALVKGGKLLGPSLTRNRQRREMAGTGYDTPEGQAGPLFSGAGVLGDDLGDLEDNL